MSDYTEEMAELQEQAEAKMIDDAIEGATKKLRARIAELEAERDSIGTMAKERGYVEGWNACEKTMVPRARDEALEEAARQCGKQGLISMRELEEAHFDVRSWNAAVVVCRDAIRALKGGKQ